MNDLRNMLYIFKECWDGKWREVEARESYN